MWSLLWEVTWPSCVCVCVQRNLNPHVHISLICVFCLSCYPVGTDQISLWSKHWKYQHATTITIFSQKQCSPYTALSTDITGGGFPPRKKTPKMEKLTAHSKNVFLFFSWNDDFSEQSRKDTKLLIFTKTDFITPVAGSAARHTSTPGRKPNHQAAVCHLIGQMTLSRRIKW